MWVVLGAIEKGVPVMVNVTGEPLMIVSRGVRSLVKLQSTVVVWLIVKLPAVAFRVTDPSNTP